MTGNISSGGKFHDTLKQWVAMWGDKRRWDATLEDRTDQNRVINPFRSDVVLRRKYGERVKGYYNIVYVEVQKDITKSWREKVEKQYKDMHYLIVDVNKYRKMKPDEWDPEENDSGEIIEYMMDQLFLQLDNEVELKTEVARKKSKDDDTNSIYMNCTKCGARIKRKNETLHLNRVCPKRHIKDEEE